MGTEDLEAVKRKSEDLLDRWVEACTRRGRISRNTVAVGIVVLDQLKEKGVVDRGEVISKGGEVRGTRASLGKRLEKYGIPARYLKEVTTRQAHQDGQKLFEMFEWGGLFGGLSDEERSKVVDGLISKLASKANEWLLRQSLKMDVDRRHSPAKWINRLLENAKGRSGGVVEQHLVGAKLARRFGEKSVPNYPAHAADRQTSRAGDFELQGLVYHVTATPSLQVIQKCGDNLREGLHPILLVPKKQEARATALAQEKGLEDEISILPIEDFVAVNIIELSTEEGKSFFSVFQEIIELYNRRLADVETDLSLKIELR